MNIAKKLSYYFENMASLARENLPDDCSGCGDIVAEANERYDEAYNGFKNTMKLLQYSIKWENLSKKGPFDAGEYLPVASFDDDLYLVKPHTTKVACFL